MKIKFPGLVTCFTYGVLFLFAHPVFCQVQNPDISGGFNIYCTSNKDSTGSCVNLKSQKLLDCLIIPGQVIDCKGSSGKKFQCVLYSQVTETQAEFFCNQDSLLTVPNENLDSDAFSSVFSSF